MELCGVPMEVTGSRSSGEGTWRDGRTHVNLFLSSGSMPSSWGFPATTERGLEGRQGECVQQVELRHKLI